jgi:hypothetical protein
MSTENYIVTTTIFKPSKALDLFSKIDGWKLIVVGDLKTPHDLYHKYKNIIYLTPSDQIKIDKNLSNLIGWNCVQRRNFGYIYAYKQGAKFVATVDDDNIPYDFWADSFKLDKKIKIKKYYTNRKVFDPISIFKFKQQIWHRGYPLQELEIKEVLKIRFKNEKFDVQANLWNKNPDIDAINRMNIKKPNFTFPVKQAYASNKISPFNSQNTILNRECIKNYFLFPFVGRMDDIWASYYVQSLGFKVFYDKPTVYQDRNAHSIYQDFILEDLGYKNNMNLINSLLKNPNKIKNFLPERSLKAFKRYQEIMK